MVTVNYLRAIHRSLDADSPSELTVSEARRRIRNDLASSVNYCKDSLVNGQPQPVCLTYTGVTYKCNVICLPGDSLCVGDMVEAREKHWIVVETDHSNPVQITGNAWLCNHLFRFQNWSSEIIERWGVLDSGVYSTTLTGDEQVQEPDKQFKVYLPYDEDTRKIHLDKRFAVDIRYTHDGQKALECYKVTGMNRVARSYGTGGHLLLLDVRSDVSSHANDNFELLICDYIPPQEEVESQGKCLLNGRKTIPISSKRKYTAVFYDNSGDPRQDVSAVWELDKSLPGVKLDTNGNNAYLIVADDTNLIGEVVSIEIKSEDGVYHGQKKVEVVG